MAHFEPPHLDLHCLQIQHLFVLISALKLRMVKGNVLSEDHVCGTLLESYLQGGIKTSRQHPKIWEDMDLCKQDEVSR